MGIDTRDTEELLKEKEGFGETPNEETPPQQNYPLLSVAVGIGIWFLSGAVGGVAGGLILLWLTT